MVGKLLLEPQALTAKERESLLISGRDGGGPGPGGRGELCSGDIKEAVMGRLYLSSCRSPSAKAALGRNHTSYEGEAGRLQEAGHLHHTR